MRHSNPWFWGALAAEVPHVCVDVNMCQMPERIKGQAALLRCIFLLQHIKFRQKSGYIALAAMSIMLRFFLFRYPVSSFSLSFTRRTWGSVSTPGIVSYSSTARVKWPTAVVVSFWSTASEPNKLSIFAFESTVFGWSSPSLLTLIFAKQTFHVRFVKYCVRVVFSHSLFRYLVSSFSLSFTPLVPKNSRNY